MPTTSPSRLSCVDLGRMAYRDAWAIQKAWVNARKSDLARFEDDKTPASTDLENRDQLLLVEHEPVITLGRRALAGHILVPAEDLNKRGVDRVEVERGGDVTYHGPGQLVVYPLLDLRHFRKDVRWYATSLMEVVVRTLAAFGIDAEPRRGDETGVWTGDAKIAALGVRIEQWFAYHGIALNVAMDLTAFDMIVPCGLAGSRVTSIARELGRPVGMDEVKPILQREFGSVFGVEVILVGRPEGALPVTG